MSESAYTQLAENILAATGLAERFDNAEESVRIIVQNITEKLQCEAADITDVLPLKEGYMNLTFRFKVAGNEYTYRHPGPGTEEITNRHAEAYAERIAGEAGIDGTFIYEDPETGWKLSHYLDGCRPVDYHNWDDVAQAMELARKLHGLDADCGYDFDLHEDTLHTISMLKEKQLNEFDDFELLREQANRFNELAKRVGARRVLCHNDFYPPNFLIDPQGGMQLLDWEFTGMSDYASDPAVFICCCEDYSYEDALRIFELYFGRELSNEELMHCMAFTCVVAFHWLAWALYQDAYSEPVGDLLYYYYRYTKLFAEKASELAEQLGY